MWVSNPRPLVGELIGLPTELPRSLPANVCVIQDKIKLTRALQYLRLTTDLGLILEANDIISVLGYVDAYHTWEEPHRRCYHSWEGSRVHQVDYAEGRL